MLGMLKCRVGKELILKIKEKIKKPNAKEKREEGMGTQKEVNGTNYGSIGMWEKKG
jgi:hypothetical protein